MKRAVLSIAFLATVGVYAQSFKLYEVIYDKEEVGTEGNLITEGDTLSDSCKAQEIDGVLHAASLTGVVVENTSGSSKTVVCEREILSKINGAEVYFCWGDCNSPAISSSELEVDTGKTGLYDFSSHYSAPVNVAGASFVRYTFYDKGNPSDAVSVVFKYITPLNLHTPLLENAATLSVYPNPTKGKLQVTGYGLQVNEIEIYDIYGRKAPLNPPEGGKQLPYGQKLPSFGGTGGGAITIDISHLSAGVYFLKIKEKVIKIIKL